MSAEEEQNSGVSETALLEEEALTDESSYDKLMSRGNITAIPAAVAGRQTDWEGLTPDEEATRKHKDQEEEYARAMEQVRIRSEQLMRRLDEQEREIHQKMAEADSRAIVLHDGRRVLVGKNGDYIDEESGQKLHGDDKQEAAGKRKANSETEDEHNALAERLKQINEARDHVRAAEELAANSAHLAADQRNVNAAQAQKEMAIAEAATDKIAYVDPGNDGDTLAALGLGGDKSDRSASFAGTLEGKDRSSIALAGDFAARAKPGAAPAPAKIATNSSLASKNPVVRV